MRRHSDSPTLQDGFFEAKADYSAAKASRFRRRRAVPSGGSHADYHYRSEGDYLRVMEYARDMDRNDVIVGQTVDRAVSNILQDGFALDTATGDDGVDADFKARWAEWADDPDQCDLAGERTWWEIEDLVLRQALVDGDHLVLPNADTGSVELVEAHRLRTPRNTKKNVVHGVLLDENRRRLQYWLTREDLDVSAVLARVGDIKAYDARDVDGFRQVFQIYTGKRSSQTRGISALAPIFDVLGMFEDINFAKLVQQQVVSCFAIFHQMDVASPVAAPMRQIGEQALVARGDGSTQTEEAIAPGMRIRGVPGEKLSMDSPNVPNPEFFIHMKLILTLIGINLGLPLIMVLLDGSETNFSGWRGAVDQARLGFRRVQKRLRRRLHDNVYTWKVRQWIAADPALQRAAARLDAKIFAHRFDLPGWPYIEPLKDRAAELLGVRNALTSHRRRCSERGTDWNDLSKEIVEDNAELISKAFLKAEELNKKHPGLGVSWREIAMLPTPDGVTVTIAPDEPPAEKPAAAKPEPPARQPARKSP
jgi:lambda family phage portal protein